MVRRNLGLPHRLISKNFNCVIWVKRSDFGLNWNAALETGGVLVSDEVKIAGELQFVKG